MDLHSPAFNAEFYYPGKLGVHYTPNASTFRLWAPTATTVTLCDHTHDARHQLRQLPQGVWEITLPGDCGGMEYTYELCHGSTTVTTVDPYATAATANSERGVVLRPTASVPRMPGIPQRDVIIYEAHVRDLTIAPDNGIANKGKFLGLCEPNTKTAQGNPSGLSYLKSLGVTHIQLLPIFDFGSIDARGDLNYGAQYNWGYDPVLYNVPEASYASDPTDPAASIAELKTLVRTLHDHGLRVIMDVVYNHVYDAATHPFGLTVPGYYFRRDAAGNYYDGTACGNETASEQLMMRKFMVDSVTYWATEFGLDGFRFDLMGIHDVTTMREIRAALDAIDPAIIMIGEGWQLGNHPAGVTPADQQHGSLLPGIGMFNDCCRDLLKGDNFELPAGGFVSKNPDFYYKDAAAFGADIPRYGAGQASHALYDNLCGAHRVRPYVDATQSVVYNEAHDNYTLYDKLRGTAALAGADDAEIARRHALATTLQLLAHGTMFVHAGQELLRSKQGAENSYNLPDTINAFDYDRATLYPEYLQLFRDLVALRQQLDWLRETDYAVIEARTEVMVVEPLRLVLRVRDAWGAGGDLTGTDATRADEGACGGNTDALLVVNATEEPYETALSGRQVACYLDNHQVTLDPASEVAPETWVTAPLSVSVLRVWQ